MAILVIGAPLLPALGASPADCGPTTLEGTLVLTDEGTLECGPGQPLVLREDLGRAGANRAATRVPLKAFFALADFQLADEESPVRGEWADGCDDFPTKSAFRPYETMVPHMMNAHFRAANRIAAGGAPITKTGFDFAVAMGDLADNQQFNEIRWVIDLLDGGKMVDPDSGARGYEGVQTNDPSGKTPLPFPIPEAQRRPGETDNLRNLANMAFWATGLRDKDGSHLPWYAVMGNHDMKIQGTIPDDDPVWREFVRRWAVGPLKVKSASGESQQAICEGKNDPEFWMKVMTDPANQMLVTADPDRRLLSRVEWIAEHSITTGVPDGHGFLPSEQLCPETPPTETIPADITRRACYWFVQEPFHFIVLDTSASEGMENGNLDPSQFAWLEQQLISSSPTYFAADGAKVENAEAKNRYIVVFAHHPLGSMVNPGYPWNSFMGNPPGVRGDVKLGEDLKALLVRFPNVILHADGHTHENRVYAHKDEAKGTGYWEVNTAAIADHPSHSRTIEIVDNRDGTLSIFAVVFDAYAPPDPRQMDWEADDPTDEMALGGADLKINENWLASTGREIMFNDPQQQKHDASGPLGAPEDRNVELIIGSPFEPGAEVLAGKTSGTLAATGGESPLRMWLVLGLLAGSVFLAAGARRYRPHHSR